MAECEFCKVLVMSYPNFDGTKYSKERKCCWVYIIIIMLVDEAQIDQIECVGKVCEDFSTNVDFIKLYRSQIIIAYGVDAAHPFSLAA